MRLAEHVGDLSRPEAEDVVSAVFLSIRKNREFFPVPPGKAYLFRAVTHGAWRVHHYAWARYVVPMDRPGTGRAGNVHAERAGGGGAAVI